MLTAAIPLLICCLFAGLLGFAAHRASICTVRAVAEVISARTAFMLASIGKSALWVVALTVPFLWLMPAAAAAIGGWQLTAAALLGGLIFGFGAAINGGCAYSTMTRLMDGEVRMALSVGGFAAGILTFLTLVDVKWLARPQPAPALITSVLTFAFALTLALLAWAIYELPRIWKRRPQRTPILHLVLAPQYRLSTAALLIGISGTVIFLLIGSPGYTITLQNYVQALVGSGAWPASARAILLLAVLAGMLASTLQRGSFRLDWRPQWSWLRNIFGGALMGLGTAMLPGGNDALVLYAIPSFSPHALPAYAALIIGAGAGLLAMKHLAGIDTRVVCNNDIYRAELQPRGSILNGHAPRE
ncbi:MAG: YeeE/YedE thiosulfate transporter family protein [Pseudolabrys sp.]